MLITARKELSEALRFALHHDRRITRCVRHKGVWVVWSVV